MFQAAFLLSGYLRRVFSQSGHLESLLATIERLLLASNFSPRWLFLMDTILYTVSFKSIELIIPPYTFYAEKTCVARRIFLVFTL